MRKIAMLVAAGLLMASVGAAALPAGASAPAKDSKFCSAAKKLPSETDALPANTKGIDKKAAIKTANKIDAAANLAPTKVKKALKTLAKVYRRVGKGDALTDIIADNGIDFAKAASTFGAYFVKNCLKTP